MVLQLHLRLHAGGPQLLRELSHVVVDIIVEASNKAAALCVFKKIEL